MDYVDLEVVDIITDYLFCVSMILSENDDFVELGWISLVFSVFGVVCFFFKYMTYRKLFGFHVAQLRKELHDMNAKRYKCRKIVKEIREKTVNMDVLSMLNACVEDIPQAIIVAVVLSNSSWNEIAVLNIMVSMILIVIKLCQIVVACCGCKDEIIPPSLQKEMANLK